MRSPKAKLEWSVRVCSVDYRVVWLRPKRVLQFDYLGKPYRWIRKSVLARAISKREKTVKVTVAGATNDFDVTLPLFVKKTRGAEGIRVGCMVVTGKEAQKIFQWLKGR